MVHVPVRVHETAGPARHVLVSPTGAFVAIDYGATFEVRDADGMPRVPRAEKMEGAELWLRERTFFVHGYEKTLDGVSSGVELRLGMEWGALQRALLVRPDHRAISAVQVGPARGREPCLVIRERSLPEHRGDACPIVSACALEGLGVAAIDDDGAVLAAMRDGTLVRVRGRERVTVASLDVVPFAVTSVDDGCVVVARAESGADVVRVGRGGDVRFRARVDVRPAQPILDGGDHRLYVVGDGVAALDGDALAWSFRSRDRVHAAAYANGDLALACAGRVLVVTRDGAIAQLFDASAGERFTAPPAIGPDGALWIAGDRGLYVAKAAN